MSFGLKNVGTIYQRIMNKVFKEEIKEMLEVYMDNIIIKSNQEELYDKHLTSIFITEELYLYPLLEEIKASYALMSVVIKQATTY